MAEFKTLDERAFRQRAVGNGGDIRPRAISAEFDGRKRRILITLNTGLEFSFDPSDVPGLSTASVKDLSDVEVNGAGNALSFPRLDADFSIAALLETFLGPLKWSKQEGRAAASRENGKLGGRPRKTPATTIS